MVPLIEQHHADIARVCQRYRVRRLELFGSATRARSFDPEKSDLDFLVEFLPLGEGEHGDAYFGLLEALQTLLGRPVDLVMTRAIRNPYFRQAVGASREVVYAA